VKLPSVTDKNDFYRDRMRSTCGVFDGTVGSIVFGNVQLRKLDIWIDNEGIGGVPYEDKIVVGMRHYKRHF
jgi:hypothetical protein